MPRRACHSVPLWPSAVCDGRAPRGGSARWGTTVCGGAQAAPHRRPHGPRRGPAVGFGVRSQQPGGRAGWGRRSPSGWPLPSMPVRAAADSSLGPRRTGAPLPPRQGGAGPPCHRPAREGEGLQPWADEADEGTSDRARAPGLVALQERFLPDAVRPGLQQRRGVPLAIRPCASS